MKRFRPDRLKYPKPKRKTKPTRTSDRPKKQRKAKLFDVEQGDFISEGEEVESEGEDEQDGSWTSASSVELSPVVVESDSTPPMLLFDPEENQPTASITITSSSFELTDNLYLNSSFATSSSSLFVESDPDSDSSASHDMPLELPSSDMSFEQPWWSNNQCLSGLPYYVENLER